jgi:hypothetical protein
MYDSNNRTPVYRLSTAIQNEADRMINNTIMVDSPDDINGGYCKELAENVYTQMNRQLPGLRILRAWQGMGSRHFFLQYGDKYYDAERPYGVDEIRMLPFFGGESAYDITVIKS